MSGLRLAGSFRLPPPAGDEDAEGDVLEYWSLRWDIDGETAAAKRDQLLYEHHDWAAAELRCTAKRLGLPEQLTQCLVLAIRRKAPVITQKA